MRPVRAHATLVSCFVLVAACAIDPYPLERPDAAVPVEDADLCEDVSSDPLNCGECGRVCDLPHAMTACVAGACVISRCLPGAEDRDGLAANGCEHFCGVPATVTSERCDGPDCCDGADNDCDGELGEDHDVSSDPLNCGGCASSCEAWPCRHVCKAPFAETACVDGRCVLTGCAAGHHDLDGDSTNGCEYACTPNPATGGSESGPGECNGIDDDCDGEVDEDFSLRGEPCGPPGLPPPCGQGTFDCVEGRVVCAGEVRPEPESCNGIDDDCDGEVDNDPVDVGQPCGDDPDGCVRGTTVCVAGAVVCDAETSPLGRPCGTDVGECARGVWSCGGGELRCAGGRGPVPEVCGDGLDNDCDGLVDEADPDLAHLGSRCDEGTGQGGVGSCDWGTYACVDGAVECVGFVRPAEEVCNALDDDCNGSIDDGIPLGSTCGPHRLEWGRTACRDGREVCVGFLPLRPELCDGLDNDGDGTVDRGASCPGEDARCIDGRCVLPCASADNALPCPPGMTCTSSGCVGALCREVACGPCERCDPSTGRCVESCIGLACPDGLVCSCGRCWPPTCQLLGCPAGERCAAGRCEPDPCADAGCGPEQGCADGECFALCEADGCEALQYCELGRCLDDPCRGVACPVGRCDRRTGECSVACVGASCLPGTVCELGTGRCVDDPCLRVRCPEGTTCEEGSCFRSAPPDPDGGPDADADAGDGAPPGAEPLWILATGGGGCSCSPAGAGAVLPLAALVLLAALGRALPRRRGP